MKVSRKVKRRSRRSRRRGYSSICRRILRNKSRRVHIGGQPPSEAYEYIRGREKAFNSRADAFDLCINSCEPGLSSEFEECIKRCSADANPIPMTNIDDLIRKDIENKAKDKERIEELQKYINKQNLK